MAENNANFANQDSTRNANDDFKSSSDKPKRTDEERKETRKGFKLLMETTAKFDELEPFQINQKEFGKALKRSSKLFQNVDTPQEAVLDAQVFKQLSRLTKVQVESLSTNAQKFTTTDFSERLLNSFKGPNCLTNFRLIGRKVQHAYARPVPFNYMFGAIDVEPKEEKEKKVRQSRKSSAVDETMATQTAKTPKNTETGASLTEMLVNSTLMQLEDAYEVNDRNPISYFNFVLDPQSFTKSVENMFHFSFLVKEGKASFRLDDEGRGLPFIAPLKTSKKQSGAHDHDKNGGDSEERHQAIISLAYDDWEEMLELLDIDEAMLHHDIEALREMRDSKKGKQYKRSK